MKIKVNGACNWDTTDTTGIKTVQLHILKWILCVWVCLCNQRNHKKNHKVENFADLCWWHKEETHRTWILVTEGRYSKLPGRSWIFSVSLGEFAMASHSCCTPFECFCFLLGEIVTMLRMSCYANPIKHKFRPGLLCKLCCLCRSGCHWAYSHHTLCVLWGGVSTKTNASYCMRVNIMRSCICVYRPGELCAHSAAEPERALCSLPGLSCLVCRWSMRKGIGWSGVSVINLVINSYRSRVKQRAVRWK